MKSLHIVFVSALFVICSANPIPDEAVSPTPTPASEITQAPVSPGAKTAVNVPTGNVPTPVTELPAVRALDEKVPEPQALPSRKGDAPIPKGEEKREVPIPAVAATEQPKPTEASTKSAITESTSPKATEKSLPVEATQTPAQQTSSVPSGQTKAIPSVESTVVPAAISGEKQVNAEAPVPIVSENVPQQLQIEPELKSAPVVAESKVEPTPAPVSVEETNESKSNSEASEESSAESSEESKESKEKDAKKTA